MSASETFLKELLEEQQLELIAFNRLHGGDINEVYKIHTSEGDFVIKLNDAARFPGMFEAEKQGLEALNGSDSFRIPAVTHCGTFQDRSFLIMEFIQTGKPSSDFWKTFARGLVKLHKTTANQFGFPADNYIGSLPQTNKWESSASDFYIVQRLLPQFKMAIDQGYEFLRLDSFYQQLEQLIPDEEPSLVHGDLWNGNYMIDESGQPVLIDPAVSYSLREMDLAMMRLFGGFDRSVYDQYQEAFPSETGFEERSRLYQLYYLLVHLNLFGSGYLGQVRGIMDRYS